MLKKVLSISGKPGLFKLVSQGKNMYIAESLVDNKRVPVYTRDKVVSLGDIAIYTETEEIPLSTVLSSIKTKENGVPVTFNSNIQPAELRDYFATILPDFDRERVYPSDIKKMVNWYNILIGVGMTDFEKQEEKAEDETVENPSEEVSKEA